MKKIFYTAAFLGLLASNLFGIELSSDGPVEYDPEDKHLIAKDNVHLISDKINIRADQIEMSPNNDFAFASGNVIFTNNKMFVLSDSIEYDLKNQQITTKQCKIYTQPVIINATRLYIEKRYQRVDNGSLYFGEPDNFTPNISAKKFEVKGFKKIHAKSVVFKIGKVPFFYLPACTFPVAQRPFWLENDYGEQNSLGFFTRNDFYFRTSLNTKIGGLLDVYTKRGFLFGPAIKYEDKNPQHQIFSESKFGFIHDKGNDKLRNNGSSLKFIEKDRFFVESKNILHFGENFDTISHLSLWSDPEVIRDFRPSWYYNDQIPESFIESTYSKNNFIISAFTRLRVNNFHDTVSQIPSLHAEMLTKTIGDTNLYHRTFINYSHLKGRDSDKTKHELDKFDAYYGIFMPINHSDWLNFTPMASVRATSYLNCTGYKDYSRAIVQVGFDSSMLFNGKSDFTNFTWWINGLKHIVQPTLQYRYIPEVKGDATNYPILERDSFETNMPIIDLADMRNIDDIKPQNMFRIGLKNTLQTSTNSYIPRDLIKLDLFQDIFLKRNFNKDTQQKDSTLSYSYIFFDVNLTNWLSFQSYSKMFTKKMTLKEMTTSTNLHDANVWKVSFLTHAIQHDVSQYGLRFSTKLNSRIELASEIQYDAKIKKFTEQQFMVKSQLGHSWTIQYCLTLRNKASRENRCQFNVKLDLIEF